VAVLEPGLVGSSQMIEVAFPKMVVMVMGGDWLLQQQVVWFF